MKSCLKYKNDIKNDSFEIAENYINMFSPRKEKKNFCFGIYSYFLFLKKTKIKGKIIIRFLQRLILNHYEIFQMNFKIL